MDDVVRSKKLRRIALELKGFPGRKLLRRFEGGAVCTAERTRKFYVLIDESTMAEFISQEDAADLGEDLFKVHEFDTEAERTAYVRKRRWDRQAW